jgi:hypothetical protein
MTTRRAFLAGLLTTTALTAIPQPPRVNRIQQLMTAYGAGPTWAEERAAPEKIVSDVRRIIAELFQVPERMLWSNEPLTEEQQRGLDAYRDHIQRLRS